MYLPMISRAQAALRQGFQGILGAIVAFTVLWGIFGARFSLSGELRGLLRSVLSFLKGVEWAEGTKNRFIMRICLLCGHSIQDM